MNNYQQPILFIAHGSPMNAIANNAYTKQISTFANNLPLPKGIVMISAHWITMNKTLVQVSNKLNTIYDFSGFPEELYNVNYKPLGSPELSHKIFNLLDLLKTTSTSINPQLDYNDNLDHGAWSILKHMFPNANVPVVQISIDYNLPHQAHFDIGQALSSLANEGYLIIGSGNLIHNLMKAERLNFSTSPSQHWASSLSNDLSNAIYSNDFNKLINFNSIPFSNIGINTADHYLPFLYSLGAGSNLTPQPIYKGFELGTLDMHSILWA